MREYSARPAGSEGCVWISGRRQDGYRTFCLRVSAVSVRGADDEGVRCPGNRLRGEMGISGGLCREEADPGGGGRLS